LKLPSKDIFAQPHLNTFMTLGKNIWKDVRLQIIAILTESQNQLEQLLQHALVKQTSAKMHMPIKIGNYTDFYSSEQHASNVGRLFRDKDNPLLPNWKHMPIAYNGRASSIITTSTAIKRPSGQLKPNPNDPPIFAPCRKLDFELEMGFFIGKENQLGEPIRTEAAWDHIFGFVLVNDWSARDIQVWEYQPLGPFLSKAFATAISPWVIPLDALAPFASQLPAEDFPPQAYLTDKQRQTVNIHLDVYLKTAKLPEPFKITHTNFTEMYWSPAQQIAHHTITGCNLQVGDLLASGTISGKTRDSWGSLLELTFNGTEPLQLPNGETRTFLEDGDEILMKAYCENQHGRIGFGELINKIF
jgi:fumarylacetoacetase